MADLVNKNKIGVVKSGSLHARIAEKELLKEIAPEQADISKLPNRLVLMIDCSGSMAGDSIKLLESAVQDFIQKSNPSDTAIAVESFPEQIRIELTDDKTKLWFMTMGLKAEGGTPMASAMRFCVNSYEMTRAIIISDGQPDSIPTDEIQLFKRQEVPIDTVHVGTYSSGEDCLKDISQATGGIFVKFKDIKQFATAFSFLLPEHRADASRLLLGSGANEVR